MGKNWDFIIGCDESGVGETFGSLILGATICSRDDLTLVSKIISRKNIKNLSPAQLQEKSKFIQSNFSSSVLNFPPKTIDVSNKITLLNEGYEKLLSKLIDDQYHYCIVIDDFGVSGSLKKFLCKLEEFGNLVIVEEKSDEKYPICQLASIIARYERVKEIEKINFENFLFDPETNKKIYPGTGSPSNPETSLYLKTFKKLHPDKQFPWFVRTKWKNVKELI